MNPTSKTNNKKYSYQSGFNVIELAIVLTVISLVMGTALNFSTSALENNRIKETRKKIEKIIETIELYSQNFRHLPCPADSNLGIDNNNFGVGTGSNTPPIDYIRFLDGLPCSASPALERSDSTGGSPFPNENPFIMGGMVPVRTLGLSPYMALDAWSRRMMYIVDQNLTWIGNGGNPSPADYAGGFTDRCAVGEIIVRWRHTSNITEYVTTNNAAFAVISFGPNGHGAWRPKGGTRLDKEVTSVDEAENSYEGNGVATELDSPPGNAEFDEVIIQKFGYEDEDFDDIVEFRTKWQLDPEYAYPKPGIPCAAGEY